MPRDNGVYILETKGSKGSEYRLSYVEDLDDIYKDFDDSNLHWRGNPKVISESFGQSKVYDDLETVWDEALQLAEKYEYLEDGVCVIANFKNQTYEDIASE